MTYLKPCPKWVAEVDSWNPRSLFSSLHWNPDESTTGPGRAERQKRRVTVYHKNHSIMNSRTINTTLWISVPWLPSPDRFCSALSRNRARQSVGERLLHEKHSPLLNPDTNTLPLPSARIFPLISCHFCCRRCRFLHPELIIPPYIQPFPFQTAPFPF